MPHSLKCVFLNLRASRTGTASASAQDRHALPATQLRQEDHAGEFSELFSHRTWYLAPLTCPDQERFIQR
ncbi:MAG: hypothetical protein R3A10_18430 [Caldilineaceae bacterium]